MEEKSFLWHHVSESEKKKIKQEAKAILDNFSAALLKVENLAEEGNVKRQDCVREEEKGKEGDKEFRKTFFENAPHENDFVKSEKGKWLK